MLYKLRNKLITNMVLTCTSIPHYLSALPVISNISKEQSDSIIKPTEQTTSYPQHALLVEQINHATIWGSPIQLQYVTLTF